MEPVIIEEIIVDITVERVTDKMRMKDKTRFAAEIEKMLEGAAAVCRPKAMYKPAYIEEKGTDFVVADGVKLSSHVLRVNLDSVHRFFPFIVTCGMELAEWAHSFESIFDRYCADTICEIALWDAYKVFEADLSQRFQPGPTSSMNPGSLPDWPLQEQAKVFALLGNPQEAVGVTLTDSFLMLPVKTVSGIRFATDADFKNCMLCPREECTGRMAAYDSELANSKYGK